MIARLLVAFMLGALALTACNPGSATQNDGRPKLREESFQTGMGLALLRGERAGSGDPRWTARRQTADNGEVAGSLMLLCTRSGTRARLLTLVDGRTVPFRLGGGASLSHDRVVSTTETVLPWRPIRPATGTREVMVLAFWNPEQHSLDPHVRLSSAGGLYSARRIEFDPDAKRSGRFRPVPSQETTSSLRGVVLNESPDDPFTLPTQLPAEKDARMRLYAHLGNPTKRVANVALTALLDYAEVRAFPEGPTTYVSLPPHSIGTVRLDIPTPKRKGVHELILVRADAQPDPTVPLSNDDVWVSMRVGIVR